MSGGEPRRARWLALGLFVTAIALYANTLGHGYVYDDQIIAKSPLADRPFALGEIFSNAFYGDASSDLALYRPLTDWSYLLTHAADRALDPSGASHFVAHATNVLLHALATVLFFAWMRRIGAALLPAALAALLFAAMPVHVESVANVTGRSDVLAACFVLGAFLAHASRAWLAAPPLFLCALWSKESVLLLPLVPLLCDAWIARSPAGARVRRLAGYAVVVVLWIPLWRAAMSGPHIGPQPIENPLVQLDHADRVLNALAIQVDYLARMLWPAHLSTDYSLAQIPLVASVFTLRVVLALLLAAAAVLGLVVLRTRVPRAAVAIAGYGLAFAITSNLALPIGTIMAERLAYMPSLFLCLLLAAPLEWARLPRSVAQAWAIVLVAGAVAHGARTVVQNRVWKDELTLFTEQVATAPNSAKAHFNLGAVLALAGKLDLAVAHYDRSIAIFPRYGHVWYCRGNALYRRRAPDAEVAPNYVEALKWAPRHHDARANLALTLLRMGQADEAREHFERLRSESPAHPSVAAIRERLEHLQRDQGGPR